MACAPCCSTQDGGDEAQIVRLLKMKKVPGQKKGRVQAWRGDGREGRQIDLSGGWDESRQREGVNKWGKGERNMKVEEYFAKGTFSSGRFGFYLIF